MIAHLRGTLLEKHPTRLIVEVGGIGLDVSVPLPVSQGAPGVGKEVSLHTVLVVREDSLTLYGFAESGQRALFLKLTSVSGIGPRIALNALSGSSVTQLVTALRDQDLPVLTRLPGIGKKTAERMSLELKDGLVEFEGGVGGGTAPGAPSRPVGDAVSALVSLGYTSAAARDAVDRAARDNGGDEQDTEALIRLALGRLTGR